jgi:hypothetical protein
MVERRLVGIDLGVASSHTVRVLAGDGRQVCRRRCEPTVASLQLVEQQALVGTPAGTRLEVVIEPTGPAWLPVAVFFISRGHTVFRVSSAKAADLRRFLSRHAKSNSIDAETLARLPLVDPAGLRPLELPDPTRAALDRRVRACDRLTLQAAEHKVRIKDLVRQLMPVTPLTGDLCQADLAVLERWADPRALLAAGKRRLTTLIVKVRTTISAPRALSSGSPPRTPPSSCMASTPPWRTPIWPKRWPPRCGCYARSRPSWPVMPPNVRTATGGPTRGSWLVRYPASARSAARPWSP